MMDRKDLFWQTYINLENDLLLISKYISFSDFKVKINKNQNQETYENNAHLLETYSPYIADYLVKCCIEIEAISKELYFSNGGAKARGSNNIYFDTDCLKLLNDIWGIGDKEVLVVASSFSFKNEENLVLKPLYNSWKRSKQYWAKAYQAVKHDRFNFLHFGNIKAAIHATAALYLLNIYYKSPKINTKYDSYKDIDYSFGSKVFSVKKPNEDYLHDVVNGKEYLGLLKSKESPFVLKYTDDTYNRILDIHKREGEKIKSFVFSQPEMKDPLFISHLNMMLKNNGKNVNIMHELFKFRFNKRFPNTLPFEQRKQLLLASQEYQTDPFHLLNKTIDISPENIQSIIDSIAINIAFAMQVNGVREKVDIAFKDGLCEILLDKNEVQYKRTNKR